MNEINDEFVLPVAQARNRREEKVPTLVDKRRFTGRPRVDVRRVDTLACEGDTIAKAAKLGGISGRRRVVEYRARPTLLSLLSSANTHLGLWPNVLREALAPTLDYRRVP